MTDPSRFPVPLTIITGFLGSGKTTLLNHLLHGDHGLKIAVLVNDFGAVNIDSRLIVGVEGETVSLANGCICCTIRDDLFKETVRLLKRSDPPQYIVVETSGVSDPAAVAMTFLMPEIQPYIIVDSILTVIDAEHILTLDEDYQELAEAQIAVADIVVLNKVDRVDSEALADVKDFIVEIVPDARILETTFGRVPLELVLGMGQYAVDRILSRPQQDIHVHEEGEHHEHHHHDHTMVFNTWTWSSPTPFTIDGVRQLIGKLPRTIYRAKGLIQLQEYPDTQVVLQVVGRRGSLSLDEPWGDQTPHNRVVVIGSRGGVDPERLTALFSSALALPKKSRAQQIIEQLELERDEYAPREL